jgi:lipopolysaccharide transport system ATP-binding protein
MAAIERLCTKAMLLESGRQIHAGAVGDVIAAYLEQDATTAIDWQREEPAPAGPHLQRVRLTNAAGESLAQVRCSEVPHLEISVVLPKPQPDLLLAFALHDSYERAIFASSPTDVGLHAPTTAGTFRYRAEMPSALLMPQTYSITVSLYSAYGTSFQSIPHVLRFEVADGQCVVHEGTHQRLGVLQLRCDWQRAKLD